ncbi:hypothetical protein JXB27_01710 [Candidatus Woesearchaeota archaeon]|nr:hypothetical protein [Candidatus Woesearchaeota archaeon]
MQLLQKKGIKGILSKIFLPQQYIAESIKDLVDNAASLKTNPWYSVESGFAWVGLKNVSATHEDNYGDCLNINDKTGKIIAHINRETNPSVLDELCSEFEDFQFKLPNVNVILRYEPNTKYCEVVSIQECSKK